MCGILGIVARSPVNQLLYDGLLLLQHRGQDAAGIVTAEHNSFHMHKAPGMVRDVFRTRNMRSLPGNIGIAHCRYPTAGSASNAAEAQPFYVNSPFGIVLGHNGNLTNSDAAEGGDVPHRPAPHQHRLGLGGAGQRARLRAREGLGQAAARSAGDLCGGGERASPRARRVRGGGDDRRLRRGRVPRSVRHPPGGDRLQRDQQRHRVHGRLRIGGGGRARLPRAARHRPGRGGVHRRGRQLLSASSARRTPASTPASSSTCTWRGPTR